ncbi:hypothetical protein CAEBREN_19156 [Caenorhabditis brenneri]|uniref:Uncharacterized protein n=1 Tax=Caenorhabditis brenneri TaxID=135651 RepID=G0MVQ1_CAEBE|nr:hypothetical protein CAEBREN_19156 [Caenorhabditis brenneri]
MKETYHVDNTLYYNEKNGFPGDPEGIPIYTVSTIPHPTVFFGWFDAMSTYYTLTGMMICLVFTILPSFLAYYSQWVLGFYSFFVLLTLYTFHVRYGLMMMFLVYSEMVLWMLNFTEYSFLIFACYYQNLNIPTPFVHIWTLSAIGCFRGIVGTRLQRWLRMVHVEQYIASQELRSVIQA